MDFRTATPPRVATALERFPFIGAGKQASERLGSEVNQGITDRVAARELGLPADTVLDKEVLEAVREKAGRAYEAVKSVPGKIRADGPFQEALTAARAHIDVEGFTPDAIDKEVLNRITMLASRAETTPAVLVQQAKRLRAKAKAAGTKGEYEAAGIMRDLASEIEKLLERELPDKALVPEMRAARQLIARSHDIEDALAGNAVDARKLGAQLKRKPFSGDLRTAAEFGQQHKKFAAVPGGAPGGNVGMDVLLGLAGGGAGYGAGDHPLAFAAGGLALPLARRGSVAALRRVYERAARQGNKEAAKHASRLMALSQDAQTGARAQLAKESFEALYRAGYLNEEAE